MNCLSPSILNADYGHLAEQIALADNAGAEYIHFDIMDGQFVPNISFGPGLVAGMRPYSDKIFDVHLMVEDPARYINVFADAGADIITVHAEACSHLDRTVEMIREKGKMACVALNPATPLSVLDYVLPKLDMVLIMTVNPGFGGQKFIPYTLDKIRDLRKMMAAMDASCDIEVDGGVTLDNVDQVLRAGANVIVAGTAVFRGDITENVEEFLTHF